MWGRSWVQTLIISHQGGICCLSAKHAALTWKSKKAGWLGIRIMCEWSDMSTRGLLFQWASTIKIQLSVLVYYKVDLIIISLKINLFSPWYSWKIGELTLNKNHSLTFVCITTQEIDLEWLISLCFLFTVCHISLFGTICTTTQRIDLESVKVWVMEWKRNETFWRSCDQFCTSIIKSCDHFCTFIVK